MKVLLLAAGRSVRMQPVPDKNFLNFFGKYLIEHQIEALKNASFDDICIIAGAHNLAALQTLAKRHTSSKIKISVIEQKKLELGMAGAILASAEWISNEPFVVMSSNDVLDESAYGLFAKSLKKDEGLLLAYTVKKYFPGGYLKIGGNGVIKEIVEKPKKGSEPSDCVNIVMHYHHKPQALIDALEGISSDRDDRYERALQTLFDKKAVYRAVPFSGFWQPVKYPWHVLALMDYYLEGGGPRLPAGRQQTAGDRKNVDIAKSAAIKGNVYLETGVKVMDNAVITGPAYIGKNTVIATGVLVRGSHIGKNCVIGFGSEVARSYLGDNVWTHTNYIGDSIIGNNVSFGAGTVTGNLRFDEGNVFVTIRGEKIDSGTHKLGLIAGDNIRTGINSSFMPGVKIGSNSCIGAGLVIGQDVPENSFITGEWKLKRHENKVRITPRGRKK